jgi:hypothetical protein
LRYHASMSGFCDYLLKKGRITELQLFRARSKCASLNLNTGHCAYAFGFISRGQIQNILGVQQRTGQRFGEIAVALGYLTAGQVQTILKLQSKYRVTMEEILVRDGALSADDLESERLLYCAESGGPSAL